MDIVYWLTDRTDADKHLVRPSSESVSFVEKIIIMSVQRRAFEQQFPKSSGMLHDSVERDAGPVRRATKPSLHWVGISAILTINERHHLIQQELRIVLAVNSSNWGLEGIVRERQILLRPVSLPWIINSNDDERRNFSALDQRCCGLIGTPLLGVENRRADIKKVLAVVQVHYRVALAALVPIFVARREPNPQHARVMKDSAGERAYIQIANNRAMRGFLSCERERVFTPPSQPCQHHPNREATDHMR